MNIINNECASICAKCGGECCLRMPGAYTPDQFGLKPSGRGHNEHNAEILAGLFGDPNGLYKVEIDIGRPSDQNFFGEYEPLSEEELALYDWCEGHVIIPTPPTGFHSRVKPGWYRCPHHDKERGCLLSFESRPTMCEALKPAQDGACLSEISLRELSTLWAPYQRILSTVEHLLYSREENWMRDIWRKYVPEGKITKEVILKYLRIRGDLWKLNQREKSSEKKRKAEEAERFKQEANPLYQALKDAGF